MAAAASFIPGVGLAVAAGLGIASAGLKVTSFVSHLVDAARERKQESDQILRSSVASFGRVHELEARV